MGPTYLTLATAGQVAVARATPGKQRPIHVPVTPAFDLAMLDIAVLAIVRDSSMQPIPTDAIKVEAQPHPAALAITIDFDAMPGPGTYEVTLGIVPRAGVAAALGSGAPAPTAPAGHAPAPAPGGAPTPTAPASGTPVRQTMTVKLLLPPAALQPISKLVIDRVVPLPFLAYAIEAPRVIALHESGNASSIEPVVTQEGILTLGDRPVGARLTVAPFSQRIEPGRVGTTEITLSGDLPIGTVSGTLWVTARDLQAPVVIPVEIRSRRPSWWVLSLFLFGAFAGLMWRTRLVARQGKLAARLRGAQIGAEIDDFLARYPPDWYEDVAKLRTRRREMVPARPETITAAEEALRGVRVERDARIDNLASLVQSGVAVTRTAWRLPMGLDLVNAASSYDLARSALENDDLAAALRWKANATASVRGVLTQCQDWAVRLEQILAVHDGSSAGVPSNARATVTATLTMLQGVLAASRGPFDKPEDGLKKLSEAWYAATALASLLREAFATFVQGIPPGLPADKLARLRAAAVVPATRPELPDTAIVEAIGAGKRIREAMRAVATECNDGTLPKPIEQAIDDGSFAAALAPLALESAQPAPGTRGRGVPISSRTPEALDIEVAAKALLIVQPTAPVVPVDVRRIKSATEDLEQELDNVSKVRWAIAAIITAFGAWAFAGDSFIGTPTECVTLLGLGFVADLTTDSAFEGVLARLKAARGVGAPSSADTGGAKSA